MATEHLAHFVLPQPLNASPMAKQKEPNPANALIAILTAPLNFS